MAECTRSRCRSSSGRRPRSGRSTPARVASRRSASGNSTPSLRMTNENTSPPVPQAPKQCQLCRSAETMKEGVFSLWKGQFALKLRPVRFSWTYWPTTSTISSRALISSTSFIALTSALPPGKIPTGQYAGTAQHLRPAGSDDTLSYLLTSILYNSHNLKKLRIDVSKCVPKIVADRAYTPCPSRSAVVRANPSVIPAT